MNLSKSSHVLYMMLFLSRTSMYLQKNQEWVLCIVWRLSGVATYANLFVGYVEQQIFKQYTGPIPDFFCRYIDDCLGTASCTHMDLERFINYVNSFHYSLKFTWEISKTCVSFLDISVLINGDALATSVSSNGV